MPDTREAYERLVATHLEKNSLWGLPIGFFGKGKKNPHWGAMLHLNIKLKDLNLSDDDRYQQLSLIVGRPITTTYQLRVCEIKTLPHFAHLLFAPQPIRVTMPELSDLIENRYPSKDTE